MDTSEKELKKFGIGLSIIFLIISFWHTQNTNIFYLSLTGSSIFLLISIILPVILHPFYVIIRRIGKLLGWINTKVLLCLVYYLVFTPIGLIIKLSSKNLLSTDIKKETESYWNDIPSDESELKTFEKQY